MSKRTLTSCVIGLVLALWIGLPGSSLAGTHGHCGDGTVDPLEPCDDGNSVDGDGCSSNCISEICGDAILENNGVDPDEECDDGNTVDGDGCEGDCTCGPCGDGVVCFDEECDDGNTIDDDACANDCTDNPVCGDAIVSPPEECDDGNTVDGDGCGNDCTVTPPADYAPTKDDQKCVNATNKAWAGVLRATNKAGGKCLKDVSSGKIAETFDDCAEAADIGKAFDKVTKADQKKCVAKIDARMFGYIGDPAAVNMAGFGGALGPQGDLLGRPANVISKSDKEHAGCQREVHKGLLRYLDALASDANFHKKACLKGKNGFQCQTPSHLALAMRVGEWKGPKELCRRWPRKVGKKCADTAVIAAHFPGECANSPTYADLVTCAAGRARFHFCVSVNTVDGLSIDCDQYEADWGGRCTPLGRSENDERATQVLSTRWQVPSLEPGGWALRAHRRDAAPSTAAQ